MSSVLQLPGQPPPSEPASMLREEQMPDGSVRLVHTTIAPNGNAAFIAFMADGTFMLQDAYGSTIMTNPAGGLLIQPAAGAVINGPDFLVRNALTGEAVSLMPQPKTEETPVAP